MKKFLVIFTLVLTFIAPNLSQAQNQASAIQSSIFFGAQYPPYQDSHINIGGYVGLEKKYTSWFSLTHTLSGAKTTLLASKYEDPNYQAVRVMYAVGARFYLGVPYVFFDLSLGLSYAYAYAYEGAQNPGEKFEHNWFGILPSATLGFNIPLTDSAFLQISLNSGVGFLRSAHKVTLDLSPSCTVQIGFSKTI